MSRLQVRFFLPLILFSLALIAARPTTAQTVTTLFNFDSSTGYSPANVTLTQGRDGLLYGTTVDGGTYGFGTAFRVSTSGAFTVLHNFSGPEGEHPWGGLTLGTDGNFYGTTMNGGSGPSYGVVYRMTSSGIVTVLHRFDGQHGFNPEAAPIQASDGNFYGSVTFTASGGGLVYKLSPKGGYSIVYSLKSSIGSNAGYAPVESTDGSTLQLCLGEQAVVGA